MKDAGHVNKFDGGGWSESRLERWAQCVTSGGQGGVTTMLGVFLAAQALFWGSEGAGVLFVDDGELLRRAVARDQIYQLLPCDGQANWCFEDETGFQLLIPGDWRDLWFDDEGRTWRTERFTFQFERIEFPPWSLSDGRNFVFSRTDSNGRTAYFHLSTLCGLSFIEFFPEEIPNLYAENRAAAFYASQCLGIGLTSERFLSHRPG